MAAETEIENLIVRLSGDVSQYTASMQEASQSTTQAAAEVKEAADKIEGFGDKLEGFAQDAASALAALGLGNVLGDALSNWQEAEDISVKLNSALEANGRNVNATRERYEEFAATMQKLTLAEDDSVLAMLRQAESFGVTGAAAEEAVQSAISLASVTDSSAESLLRFTAAIAKGDVETAMRFARMIPQLRGVKNESEFLAKAQHLIATGFKAAQAEVNTSSGAVKALKRDWGNLLEGFGQFIAQAIQPLVGWLTQAVAWLEGLSDETKTVVTVVAAVTAAFLALGPAISLIGLIAGVVFTPIAAVILVVGVALGALVNHLGGVEKAWELVKEKAVAAWDWIEPVRQALESFFSAVWDVVKEVFGSIRDFVVEVWQSISSSTDIDWAYIRDTIRDAILFAEFTIRNFGQVMEYVWTSVKLSFVSFANEVEYFFKEVVPAVAAWFSKNWKDIFTDIWEWTKTVFSNLAENIGNIVENIKGLISGQVKFSDIWKPLQEGFERVTEELVLPDRVLGDLEKELMAMKDLQGDALAQSFEEFKRKKLEEFNKEWFGDDDEIVSAGRKAGENFTKGAGQTLGKFDAALRFSAEFASRAQEFRDRMRIGTPGSTSGTADNPIRFDASQRSDAETTGKKEESVTVLKDIRKILEEANKKPGLVVEPANIG